MTFTHRRANRQYVAMTDEEVWKFLESKDRLFVAFPGPDGYPHVTPVWFCVIDGRVYLRVQDYKQKVKLAAGGKVCCSIDDGRYYRELRGVVVWGSAKILADPDLILKVNSAFNVRYRREQWKESEMPKWWVRERKREGRAFIEVVPERVSSWDNTKLAVPREEPRLVFDQRSRPA